MYIGVGNLADHHTLVKWPPDNRGLPRFDYFFLLRVSVHLQRPGDNELASSSICGLGGIYRQIIYCRVKKQPQEMSSQEQTGCTIVLPCIDLMTLKIKIWWGVLTIGNKRSTEARSRHIQRGSLLLKPCSSQVSTISLHLAHIHVNLAKKSATMGSPSVCCRLMVDCFSQVTYCFHPVLTDVAWHRDTQEATLYVTF